MGEKNTYLYTFDRRELETLGYKLERELGAGCENYGYGKYFIISDKKLHKYTPISINSDKGMEEYLNLRYIKSQIDFNVRNGVVYTNKPGLLIWKNGENIKKICSILGKNFIKVKKLYKSEDEIIQELDRRFSENEKWRIFITALKNNQMKVLAALAKNPITQIRAGGEYS